MKRIPKPGTETAAVLMGTTFSAILLVLTAMNAGPLWRDETNTFNLARRGVPDEVADTFSRFYLPAVHPMCLL